MKIILGITTVLLLAVFSVAYLYFSNLTVDSRSTGRTLAAIPADASLIFNFSNDKSLYDIFRDYPVFDAITGNRKKKEFSWLKDLLLNGQELYSASQGQKIFLSFHPLQSDSLQLLWVMPLKNDLEISDLENVLKSRKQNNVQVTGAADDATLEISNKDIVGTFYLAIDRGIARGSFSKDLLVKSLDKSAPKIDEEFAKEINGAVLKDNDALASLFINHHKPGFLKPFFKQEPGGNFGLFSSFAAYSTHTLNYKSDALMFNGITRITDKHDGYLNLFLKQQPAKNTIKRIIPSNMSNAICYGLSDYGLFDKDLKRLFSLRKEKSKLDEQMQLITTETGVNAGRDIKKLWGNEFASIQLSTFETLAVIRLTNGRQLEFFLEPLSSFYSDAVRKMNYENLFYYYFGDPLIKYKKPFFAVTDNMLILSNSPGTVQRFLNDYNADRLLYNNESYAKFDQLVADQSNVSFMLQLPNSKSLLRSLLKKNYSGLHDDKNYGFKDFYGLSYQLTSNTDHFFTNFYLGYKDNAASKPDSLVYSR